MSYVWELDVTELANLILTILVNNPLLIERIDRHSVLSIGTSFLHDLDLFIPGGSVFIKTNWHCPKDAIWITVGQTLRVNDLTDVYQLLKASTICKEDLKQVEQSNFNHLVFKRWKEIHPGTEFRCFVRDRNLIAVSPRDWPQYHEHFKTQKQDIIKDIVSIFKEKIKDRFPIDNCK